MIKKENLSVLFIVQAGRKHGIGHLKRILQMTSYYTKPFIFIISDQKNNDYFHSLLSEYHFVISSPDNKVNISDTLKEFTFDLIICDTPAPTHSVISTLENCYIPTITLDNSKLGLCSEIYLAPLPTYKQKQANFSDIHYTPIDTKFCLPSQEHAPIKNILITLGGSDPTNNAEKLVNSLKDLPYNITVIAGPFSKYNIEPQENITIVSKVTDLFSYIENNDLIFCGPGSTLFESLTAKKKVVVITHTFYQFLDLSTMPNLTVLLGGWFLTSTKIRNSIQKSSILDLNRPENFNYQEWMMSLSKSIIGKPAICPLCHSQHKTSLERNTEQTIFICKNCQSTYVYCFQITTQDEDCDFIIANDFEQNIQSYKNNVLLLREDSNRRIQIMKKILPTPSQHHSYRLLDIGAEHGVFVQEANHNGFSAQGVELSAFARKIALDQFNITIIDDMEKVYNNGPVNHIVTIWKKLHLLMYPIDYLKKISVLLPIGGLLALRLPTKNQINTHTGYFQITEKGGRLLAEQAGFFVVQTAEYKAIDNTKYLEFYCIKRNHNELH